MSSGTILGPTFAALYPERVHLMVIHGAIDLADHYAGAWRTQLDDSDKTISKFSEYCFQAGLRCPPSANSSTDPIEDRLKLALNSHKYEPIPVNFTSDGMAAPTWSPTRTLSTPVSHVPASRFGRHMLRYFAVA